MRKSLSLTLMAVAAVLVFGTATAQAQVHWGARVGAYMDGGTDTFVGVEAITPVARNIFFNPNVEYVAANNDYLTINADLHYDFPTRSNTFFWGGGGIGALVGDGTDLVANVLAGAGIRAGAFVPYVQAKGVFANENRFVIGVGVRY
ncbi:MAG: hypothetical protein WBX15_01930 [Thermoanaerobaculia bacterium]